MHNICTFRNYKGKTMEIYVQNIFGACKKIKYEHSNTVNHPGNNLI